MSDKVLNIDARVYIADSALLKDDGLFDVLYSQVPVYRRKVIDSKESVEDKRSALAASVLLSHALRAAGFRADDMILKYNKHGKPFFEDHPEMDFSLAYSEDRAMCALSVADGPFGCEIGCDVEKNTKEQAEYLDQHNMTVDGWTRLESYAKATQTSMEQLFFGGANVVPGFFFSHPEIDDEYKYNICCRMKIPAENMTFVDLKEMVQK
ncbi:MAG: hypothetical protein K6C05_02065 [Anaerovibrio sp.]|uniref:4'-phosphopantetheinyl transferase family protein n=1 Tax=Anaerovibrio sp. TaxID=1872532 RepID=UPI0025ECC8F2|nr:hypothetical protein [Anaerovibrio sp.]MCR5175617.1 hypothetical protein [Anaerovibrio sp.]